MNRYELSNDFRKKFVEQNENVWSKTVRPTYFSINDEETRTSSNPYSMENAEHALVVFHYNYTVITSECTSLVPLFFNANGDVEDYIEIDGWRFSFGKPVTALYKCNAISCTFSKDGLSASIRIHPLEFDQSFDRIWKLFCIARTCKTQRELDFLCAMFYREAEILKLKEKNLWQEAELDRQKMVVSAYKGLLDKIQMYVNGDMVEK